MVKNSISFPEFQKLDLRVSKVTKAENVDRSKNLVRMIVDLGSDYGDRKILAGISSWYSTSDRIFPNTHLDLFEFNLQILGNL